MISRVSTLVVGGGLRGTLARRIGGAALLVLALTLWFAYAARADILRAEAEQVANAQAAAAVSQIDGTLQTVQARVAQLAQLAASIPDRQLVRAYLRDLLPRIPQDQASGAWVIYAGTPLNAIMGFAELLHDGKIGLVSTDQQEFLGDILTSSRHLLRIINDILDLSKVEAGKTEFRPEPVDPVQLVAEVCAVVRTLAAHKRLRLSTEIDPALGPLVLDPARLKQVLYNYLSNAIKFSHTGGTITISVTAEDADRFRLSVQDTGIGISAEDQARLFTEFAQLEEGTATPEQGTGLGLALTRRIVEAQGGRVGVTSALGAGSAFHAVLPRTTLQHAPPVGPSRSAATPLTR